MSDTTPKPIYVLHGSDGYLQSRHRRGLVDRLIGGADPQMCLSTHDATAELAAVLDELRTQPLLAPVRVVIVRDADAFVSGNRQALEEYVQSPSPTGALVLMVSSWNKSTRLAKITAKVGEVFDCSEPQTGQVARHLQEFASNRGKRLDRQAAALLGQWVGADLSSLDQEIEKLSVYVGQRETITPEDVSAVVTASAGPGAFDLTNAITAGNTAEAIKALSGMLTVRGEEFRTLGLIGWHLRKAIKTAEMIDQGASPDAACRAAKVPGFQTRQFAGMVRKRGLRKLQGDFRKLIAADLGMKSGLDARSAMQDLVIGLCTC
jgi:DNA polymerase-3 subunit delta